VFGLDSVLLWSLNEFWFYIASVSVIRQVLLRWLLLTHSTFVCFCETNFLMFVSQTKIGTLLMLVVHYLCVTKGV